MYWLALIVASLFEAVVPLLIIRSDNYTRGFYVGLLVVTVVASVAGLRFAMRAIPLGVAYTVWTALGILGTVLVGLVVLGETLNGNEIVSLGLIVVAVAGLRVSSS